MSCYITLKILSVLLLVESSKAFRIPFETHVLTSNSSSDEIRHIHHHLKAVSVQDMLQMTRDELGFLYFKIYDGDNDDKLDGCEIIQSLFHRQTERLDGKQANMSTATIKIFGSEELAKLVDPILDSDDKDKDGYIDFTEYVLSEVQRLDQRNSENRQSMQMASYDNDYNTTDVELKLDFIL